MKRLPAGFWVIAGLAALALLAPWIAPHDPQLPSLELELARPQAAHWLGCDELGRDLLSRVLWGARSSLLVGVPVVLVSTVLGTLVGLVAGYRRGAWDFALMRIVDLLQAFPGLLLALGLAFLLGPSLLNLIAALSALGWVGYARIVRGQVLELREREFVQAARVMGGSGVAIAWRHLLPNLYGLLAVQGAFSLGSAILAESTLAFLGLGSPGRPSWGGMLDSGIDYLLLAPHVGLVPGAALALAVLGFNLSGESLRDLLDVKSGSST